jgi:gluconate 2-dehydrogenase alpha chain
VETLAPVDVVIVGAGWAGMIMAKEIASRTSLSVLLLERGGPFRGFGAYAMEMDEVDTQLRGRHMANAANGVFTSRSSHTDRANPVRQFGGHHPGTGVGGCSDHWGGTSPRFLPEAFTLATHLKERHGAAKLPADLTIQDWGITWKDIEPFYMTAERMMGTGGKAGNLKGKKIDGGNIFEGPRSGEFPNPPHPMTYMPLLFAKTAKDLGYQPFPMPSSTLSQPYTTPDGVASAPCMYCGRCSLYGCMVGAKASPNSRLLPLLEKKKNMRIRTGSQVRRVVHRGGKAVGVSYTDESGRDFMQPADAVVLSAWALNNARLLMLSGIGQQYDPVTGKGTLGKNATYNVSQSVEFFLGKPLNNFMGSGGLGMAIGDFAGDAPEEDVAQGAFRGGLIFAYTQGTSPIASFGKVPREKVKSNWGSQWKKAVLEHQDRSAGFICAQNHFAYRGNYMDLDPTYKDKWGDPLLRVTMNWTDADKKQAAFIARKEVAIAKAMGATDIEVPNATSRAPGTGHEHSHGGTIMGISPETSVLNRHLQHWQIPNLWVVGGSAFPQVDSQPTLTIAALSYWAADAFVSRYLKRPGALA